MLINQISSRVHCVSVLNPSLRVFDIVMQSNYGTTYNSYVVDGGQEVALIECTHSEKFDYYLDNIKNTTDISKIKYIILNHNEPDHSGAIADIVNAIPDITIVVSAVGAKYIKEILNETVANIKVVKNGDTLTVGDAELEFCSAPFLHWPDTMFTYLKQDKLLFTCDFLGSHFCEPRLIDLKMSKSDIEFYMTELQKYYDAIFAPFKSFVVAGLEKLSSFDVDTVAVSHGPVLTKQGLLDEVVNKYKLWSSTPVKEHKTIPIFYCSAYSNTKSMATSIAEGISSVLPDAEVNCYDVIKHDMDELAQLLNNSDAFLLGSPTINRDAVPPIWQLLCHVDAVNIVKRPVAIFGSYGWSGESFANLRGRLTGLKANVFEQDLKVMFVPSKQELQQSFDYGVEFAKTI